MNNKILIFSTLLLSISVSAQSFKNPRKTILVNSSNGSNLSVNTIKLIEDHNKIHSDDFGLLSVTKDKEVRIFLRLKNNCVFDFSSSFFSSVLDYGNNLYTASVNIDQLKDIKEIDCIENADVGKNLIFNDASVKAQTNVSNVHNGIGLDSSYLGDGVIVGIIDIGFDYDHPNFKDGNGDMRISRVWERDNPNGNPPTINGETLYGSEFVGEIDILNKAYDMPNQSHGTHVAGIAAGNIGVAPKSEIVLVSGFGGQYADAIYYLISYAEQVNKPIVINMSFTSDSTSSRDGNSNNELIIENKGWSSKEGVVLVAAAGNDGDKPKHLKLDFSESSYKNILPYDFTKSFSTDLSFQSDLKLGFYGDTDESEVNFTVDFSIYDFKDDTWDSDPYVIEVTNEFKNDSISIVDDDSDEFKIKYVKGFHENRNILVIHDIEINNYDAGDLIIPTVYGENETIHVYEITPKKNYGFGILPDYNFIEPDYEYIVYPPALSQNVIAVGSYDISAGNPGELSNFSSVGPSIDNRIKPDITAPGNEVYSSVNIYDQNYNGEEYAYMPGTSMASPVVAGITALWLEKDPTLNTIEVLSLIAQNSIKDQYTEQDLNTPNYLWGNGKIDAYQSLVTLTNKYFETLDYFIYPNPTSSSIYISMDFEFAKIYDLNGKEIIKSTSKTIDLSELPSSIYLLRLYDKSNKVLGTSKVVKQ
ncbi:MAG: S8 family serine peptidase [Flavobacteriaceae bacterium]